MFRRDRISPCLRSPPRPAYAQGFGGLGLSPPKLQRRRKAGIQGPRTPALIALDSRVRGNERNMLWSRALRQRAYVTAVGAIRLSLVSRLRNSRCVRLHGLWPPGTIFITNPADCSAD